MPRVAQRCPLSACVIVLLALTASNVAAALVAILPPSPGEGRLVEYEVSLRQAPSSDAASVLLGVAGAHHGMDETGRGREAGSHHAARQPWRGLEGWGRREVKQRLWVEMDCFLRLLFLFRRLVLLRLLSEQSRRAYISFLN